MPELACNSWKVSYMGKSILLHLSFLQHSLLQVTVIIIIKFLLRLLASL